jgi:hypothetical protein
MRLALFAAAIVTAFAHGAPQAAPFSEPAVRQAMQRTETLMRESGISVPGYSHSLPPQTESVAASHIYLQGNDGAFVAGRIYLNADAIEACRDLTLLHELVHDATVKYRLFQSVPNHAVRNVIEALADRIAGAAALDPYRPGCLPKRRFEYSTAELAGLAAP